jgi:phage terminase large subunit-like protein
MTSTEIDEVTADPFLIANHLYGPSYVSLDSALSYWGLIPESVYQITSVCFKPSKSLNAAGRRYRFQHVPTDYYTLGIQTVERTPTQHVLIASPEKALCDKIVCTSGMLIRSAKQAHQLLFEDLRINENQLSELNPDTIKSWIPTAPKAKSLEYVLEIMDKL